MTNAGYTIITMECFEKSSKGTEYYIVLGRKYTKYGAQYVTWEARRDVHGNTSNMSYYWGHYTDSEARAYKDYHNRLADLYELQIDDKSLVIKEA